MSDLDQKRVDTKAISAFVGVLSATLPNATVTYGQLPSRSLTATQGAPMPTPDQIVDAKISAVEARMDTKVIDLRGELRLVGERLSGLKDRVDDLSGKLASVPSELATLTERVAHLPTKTGMDARLAGMLALIAALIAFGDKIRAFVH